MKSITLNNKTYNLGCNKSDPKKLAKELRLAHYLDASVLTEFIPPVIKQYQGVPQFMDLNDTLGDCVVACMAKMVRGWTFNATGTAATVTNQDILTVYEKGAGYNPNDPSTDQGWDLISQLAWWQKTGIAGHKIGAYASINPLHHFMVRAAVYLFGGIDVAFDVPRSINGQTIWDVVSNDGGIEGGHCVNVQGFNAAGNILLETWGYEQEVTWAFWDKYFTEAHAIISPEMLKGTTAPITGLDISGLTADLALVTA
jgi:hypothetical protein